MTEKRGCVFISRTILDSAIWSDDPEILKLFIYLILEARHSEKPKKYPGFNVNRGELITSLSEISCNNEYLSGRSRKKWSRSKVSRMLEILQNQEYITKIADTYGTHIRINNYNTFQSLDNYKSDNSGTLVKQQCNDSETTVKRQCNNPANTLRTNNNDNNVNNVENENNENKQIEKIKNTWMTYQKFPNFQGLLGFKSHDNRMNEYIEKQLQYADVEEIEQAIKNFGQIAGNENYVDYMPCTIHKFFELRLKNKDIESFFDNAQPLRMKLKSRKPETETEKIDRENKEHIRKVEKQEEEEKQANKYKDLHINKEDIIEEW